MTERQTETAAMYRENEAQAERESIAATRAYCAHLSCIADIQGGDARFDMVDGMMDYLTDPLFSREHVADAWPEFADWKKADDERRARVRAESRKAVA
jgi:hypothetical protein